LSILQYELSIARLHASLVIIMQILSVAAHYFQGVFQVGFMGWLSSCAIRVDQKTNDADVALWKNDSSATESVTPSLPIDAGRCAHAIFFWSSSLVNATLLLHVTKSNSWHHSWLGTVSLLRDCQLNVMRTFLPLSIVATGWEIGVWYD
jgi:hypothetical protein